MVDETTTAATPGTDTPIVNTGFNAPVDGSLNADKATGAAQSLKDSAGKFAREAGDKARNYVADGKNKAGSALDDVAKMIEDAAATVDEKIGPQYGTYARSAAQGIANLSEGLKGKDVEDLIADAQGFVRKSPAVAIGIAAALGFVVARLVKAGLDTADGLADGSAPAKTPTAPTVSEPTAPAAVSMPDL